MNCESGRYEAWNGKRCDEGHYTAGPPRLCNYPGDEAAVSDFHPSRAEDGSRTRACVLDIRRSRSEVLRAAVTLLPLGVYRYSFSRTETKNRLLNRNLSLRSLLLGLLKILLSPLRLFDGQIMEVIESLPDHPFINIREAVNKVISRTLPSCLPINTCPF